MIARSRSWRWRALRAGALAAAAALAHAQAPPPAAAARAEEAAAAAAAEWRYVVAPGDNLYTLAHTYLAPGVAWQRLQQRNRVANPLHLEPGRELRMPLAWLRADPGVATVVFVAGVARRDAGGAQLAIGDELRAGDVVGTEPGATLTLRLVDASRVLVAGGARVRIESLLQIGPRKVLDVRLGVEQGEAESQVNPRQVPGTRYEIRTPALTLGVRGTEFRIRVDEQAARTRAEVTQGRVGARPAAAAAGREAAIEAGYGRVADAAGLGPAQALLGAPQLDAIALLQERLPLVFAWPALAGAAGYRAQVAGDAGFEQRLLDSAGTEPSARWADLPDGDYVLRVRARDAAGLEGRSAQVAFSVNVRPEPPLLTAPRRESRVYGSAVDLGWTRAGEALRYRLQVAPLADPGFAAPLVDRDDLTAASLPLALPPGSYQWRVASIGAGDDRGPFGDAGRFELRAVPPSAQIEPPRPRGDQLVVAWSARGDGERYDVQVARDAGFAEPVLERRLERPELVLDGLAAGSWYLRVRTLEPDGFVGPWGTSQQFELPRSAWWWLLPGVVWLLLL